MLQIRDIAEPTQEHGHYGVFETLNTTRVAFVKYNSESDRWKATVWWEGTPEREQHFRDLENAISWASREVS